MRQTFYRGYCWYRIDDHALCADVKYPNTAGVRTLHTFRDHTAAPKTAWVWKRAHGERLWVLHTKLWSCPIESIDGIPWEIHEIEDEMAYQAALAAYTEEAAL